MAYMLHKASLMNPCSPVYIRKINKGISAPALFSKTSSCKNMTNDMVYHFVSKDPVCLSFSTLLPRQFVVQ
jgi:hypothetical protein